MIFVSGTKRSGTSMWMQILVGAGLPYVGEPFLAKWEDAIAAANRRGFFESGLRKGIFYATNPHPETGVFLRPDQTRRVVVKVFTTGLVRTDYAYLDRVIGTMRDWREYSRSLRRLYSMENAWMEGRLAEGAVTAEEVERMHQARGPLPPAVEWWFQNYDLMRDVAVRQYPFHLTTFDRVLADPEREIAPVLKWLGGGDLAGALAAVDGAMRTQRAAPPAGDSQEDVDDETAALFDELYGHIDAGRGLSTAFLGRMNETHRHMEERWDASLRRTDLLR